MKTLNRIILFISAGIMVILTYLKITHEITLSWLWVFAPVWFPLAVGLFTIFFVLMKYSRKQ